MGGERWSKVSGRIGEYPWDNLVPYAERAKAHPLGLVDLSIGTPVDPTPQVVRDALTAYADAPGYPVTIGTAATRQACLDYLERRCGVTGLGLDAVIPAIGLKEAIAQIPLHLGIGPGDTVVYPELAYPTYEVGALLVGATPLALDDVTTLTEPPAIVWINSPSNPSGQVQSREQLKRTVDWCREHDVLLVSDECYLEFVWEGEPALSVLHPDISGGDPTGLLVVHSLSKRSNMAGYRCGFIAGDPDPIAELLTVRKNLGLMMPDPMQAAMAAALRDDQHVTEQLARYRSRRGRLRDVLVGAGFDVSASTGSLYLWITREGDDCWSMVDWFAERGILVGPGTYYGPLGKDYVRISITVTDERCDAAVARLA